MNGRRLLQEVVQKERRLRRDLHDTVERKELISNRMVKHQVSPSESTQNNPLSQVTNPPKSSQPLFAVRHLLFGDCAPPLSFSP